MLILFIFFIVSLSSGYVFYRIYNNELFIFLLPILTFLPLVILIITKFDLNTITKYILGNYLFLLNSIILISIPFLLLYILFGFLNFDFLEFLSDRKYIFSIILIGSLILLGVIGKKNYINIAVREYKIPKIPGKTSNLRFGFITDVHLNDIFGWSKLEYALSKMEEKNVDFVLIGGDLLDDSHIIVKDDIKSIFEKYKFKNGIHMVMGNHEYYGGIKSNYDYIKNLGINILTDNILNIENLSIIGRDDNTNKNRKSMKKLLENIDENNITIVMDHNPIFLKELNGENIDVYLAGHTHNGQMFPYNILVKYMYANSYGYKKIKNTHTYVSSGLGIWLIPYRTGSQSEFAIFEF